MRQQGKKKEKKENDEQEKKKHHSDAANKRLEHTIWPVEFQSDQRLISMTFFLCECMRGGEWFFCEGGGGGEFFCGGESGT